MHKAAGRSAAGAEACSDVHARLWAEALDATISMFVPTFDVQLNTYQVRIAGLHRLDY